MKKITHPPQKKPPLNHYTLKDQCIAEFIGTGLLMFFGVGCVAALKLTGASFGLWEISLIWGMGVAMAVYLTAAISGAHLNPAVTITFWLFSSFNIRKVMPYILAQMLGAFCGVALIYGLYHNLFIVFEQNHHMTRGAANSLELAGVFFTYPHQHISVYQAFIVETVITAILMCLILALTDDGHGIPRGPLAPLLIGILIAVIGASIGPLTGFALNPARDFGARIFAYLAGWGTIAFTGGCDIPYFIIPIFAPILGAILGAFSYRMLIGRRMADICHIKKT